eukprot:TRINITY_DN22735_c0_g1_i1.p1 TRINITY_DN22735_c0_g1~~TRINITY_DN22735_c0_g1_i1.p1  ORF type:complete len:439 (-),score=83.00 TRINITY_DN22735_c0_g1_i1:348-1664(-)
MANDLKAQLELIEDILGQPGGDDMAFEMLRECAQNREQVERDAMLLLESGNEQGFSDTSDLLERLDRLLRRMETTATTAAPSANVATVVHTSSEASVTACPPDPMSTATAAVDGAGQAPSDMHTSDKLEKEGKEHSQQDVETINEFGGFPAPAATEANAFEGAGAGDWPSKSGENGSSGDAGDWPASNAWPDVQSADALGGYPATGGWSSLTPGAHISDARPSASARELGPSPSLNTPESLTPAGSSPAPVGPSKVADSEPSPVTTPSEAPELQVGDQLQALSGKAYRRKDGTDCYREKDNGRITRFCSNDKGQEGFNVMWERTGQVTGIAKADWPQYFTYVASVPELQIDDRLQALPGKEYQRKDGVYCYKERDIGRIVKVCTNSRGETGFNISWDRTGQVTGMRRDEWPQHFAWIGKQEEKSENRLERIRKEFSCC